MGHSPFSFVSREYPDRSGVYLMKDGSGRILYVGKAKSLRKRLASYFRSQERLTPKTAALVARVERVDVLLTSTEKEALLLEESLIKKHRPRYNIVLRDDKQYLLFRLDRQSDYPRLVMTRRVEHDGSVYFGPFTSALSARETWRLLGKVFPLRKCSDAVFRNRVRPCLYHDLGQCLAPCVLPVDRALYAGLVRRVEQFLSGHGGDLLRQLKADMEAAAAALEFERAAQLRDQLRAVARTVERQAVVLSGGGDLDVLGLAESGGGLGLGQIFVRQGRVLDQKQFFWPGLGLEEGPEVLESFLVQFYGPERFIPPRIAIPEPPRSPDIAELLAERRQGPVRLVTALRGPVRSLSDLAVEVAGRAGEQRGETDLPAALQRRLHLAVRPERIEGVDASHLGGRGLRVGLVVFENGRRKPEDSRQYAFEGLAAGDDYAALAAWAKRRVESGPPWPDLVLVDGGKGQLAAVERGLAEADCCWEEIPVFELAAIAKGPTRRAGELEDRIFRPGRKNPLALSPGSPELLFLQSVRDAAHRFVLSRQRRSRKKAALQSAVQDLPGVGPKTARLLWDRFGSLEAMRAAGLEDLTALPGLGPAKAARLHASLAALSGPGDDPS